MGVSPVLSSEENAGEMPTPPKNSRTQKRTLHITNLCPGLRQSMASKAETPVEEYQAVY